MEVPHLRLGGKLRMGELRNIQRRGDCKRQKVFLDGMERTREKWVEIWAALAI